MVVQVGDKVLVYGAGTPWAFAKKIEPVEVGAKVDVVTLSDGTKLAMPKIELDLSEYVWVVPEFDTPFNIGDVPFQWGMMPLGAAVFTLTDILDCWHVEDSDREWPEDQSLSGCLMIVLTGKNRGVRYAIASHNQHIYTLTLETLVPDFDYSDWNIIPSGGTCSITNGKTLKIVGSSDNLLNLHIWLYSPSCEIMGAGGISFDLKLYLEMYPYENASIYGCNLKTYLVRASTVYSLPDLVALGISGSGYINPNYPESDTVTYPFPLTFSGQFVDQVFVMAHNPGYHIDLEIGPPVWLPPDCVTEGLSAGDKYVIYNPVTNRLVFNDATKTVISSASWRAISYPGEVVALEAVEYVWDGQGYVYLTQSKTTLSTIFYDNELRVEAFGDTGDVRAIDYHTNDEFTYSGETVSRELVNITSILRAGKNYVQLKARDTGGTKVGFPTPIYIKRDMS